MKQSGFRTEKGFTLIELLLVIGIISVLAVVVFVALDPAKRFADARDARRNSDVQNILSAIHQYIIDNKGALPSGLGTTENQIGTATSGCGLVAGECNVGATACLDMSANLAKYLKSIPTDPQNGTAGTTHYSVQTDVNGIVTVRACDTEGTTAISISR
ncbi:MAG: type II secretion system protein [Candidatus Moranbacteria bacterium]|nr:type II secretion system protein [Candidatus Moranbacteria bacterium]